MSGSRASTGVLLMAHGTPASLTTCRYLSLVRGGRPPSAYFIEKCAATIRRSADARLTDLTMAQAEALRRTWRHLSVAVGMRNWTPFIADAIAEFSRRGRLTHHRHPARPSVFNLERRQVLRRGEPGASGRHAARTYRVVSPASSAHRGLRGTRRPGGTPLRRNHRVHRAQPPRPRHRRRR